MRRFSILGLMGLVFALAVGLAALRDANEYWAGGLLLATPLLLCLALVGAMCGKERSRAGRLGFAAFGGTYFALVFLGLSDGNLNKLPTSKLLWFVHERVAGTRTFSVVLTTTTTTATSGGPAGITITKTPQMGTFVANPGSAATGTVFEDVSLDTGLPVNRWRTFLPGAADLQSFSAVGHCLFALLAGVLGVFVARRFARGAGAIPSPSTSRTTDHETR